MAQILVRNVDDATLRALKQRAKRRRTSLQQEVKSILEEAARFAVLDSESVARRIQANLRKRGLDYSDSAESQAEDRVR